MCEFGIKLTTRDRGGNKGKRGRDGCGKAVVDGNERRRLGGGSLSDSTTGITPTITVVRFLERREVSLPNS